MPDTPTPTPDATPDPKPPERLRAYQTPLGGWWLTESSVPLDRHKVAGYPVLEYLPATPERKHVRELREACETLVRWDNSRYTDASTAARALIDAVVLARIALNLTREAEAAKAEGERP